MYMKTVIVDGKSPGAYAPILKGYQKSDDAIASVVLGCEAMGYAAGVLVLCFYREHVELAWLFVSRSFRRCGIAKMLLREALSFDQADHIPMEANVTKSGGKICVPELLLLSLGFERKLEVPVYSFGLSEIISGPLFKKTLSNDPHCVYRDGITKSKWLKYRNDIVGNKSFSLFREEDVPPLSVLYIDSGKLSGILVIGENRDGSLELSLICANGTPMMLALSQMAVKRIVKEYPPETKIYAAALSDKMERAIGGVCTNRHKLEAVSIRYGRG